MKFSFFQVDHNQRVSERIWGQTRQGILDAVKDDISCFTKLLQNLTAGNKVICRISLQNCGTEDVSKEDMERLNSTRWLNDVILNAYISLIMQKNEVIGVSKNEK